MLRAGSRAKNQSGKSFQLQSNEILRIYEGEERKIAPWATIKFQSNENLRDFSPVRNQNLK